MPYNEKHKEQTLKYAREKLKRVPLDMQLSDYDKLKQTATDNGFTVNGFIKEAIQEKIGRLGSVKSDTD